jgi:hypothetical protein
LPALREEGPLEESVAEIHAYPVRPEGFEEPLFSTGGSRRAVAEHLLRAPWLSRASELAGGRAARARREPVGVENLGGRVWVTRASGRGRSRRAWVVEGLARWREVGWWWDEDRAADRTTARVLLSDGTVADLARENPGGWFVVGVLD